ncbi:hypothetical protein Mpsy_2117 [Methanolobus psychrophilus R15]|nr:hypothetical protein Mpsy_2117 [Methanolobus psychrophilus R15]
MGVEDGVAWKCRNGLTKTILLKMISVREVNNTKELQEQEIKLMPC